MEKLDTIAHAASGLERELECEEPPVFDDEARREGQHWWSWVLWSGAGGVASVGRCVGALNALVDSLKALITPEPRRLMDKLHSALRNGDEPAACRPGRNR
jgi:hypothetical protein